MTEPEVAGSDPTLIRTNAYQDGEEWVINGHKWFISNAHRASFAILIARTEEDPEIPQAANTAFLVDIPSEGWTEVRQIETMHGGTGHSEILIEDLRVHESQMLGGRGQGHLLGQYRLGPARLAHCMRWIAQAETALDMMVDRSLNRYAHGSLLAEKQGIQWMIADSAMELYQAKLMVLHAAYKIDRGDDFKGEVSMAKHFVANMLGRVIDRSIQVHGALGYSTDTPLAHMYQHARWARFADGADEVHQMRIAQRTIAAYKDTGSTNAATGALPDLSPAGRSGQVVGPARSSDVSADACASIWSATCWGAWAVEGSRPWHCSRISGGTRDWSSWPPGGPWPGSWAHWWGPTRRWPSSSTTAAGSVRRTRRPPSWCVPTTRSGASPPRRGSSASPGPTWPVTWRSGATSTPSSGSATASPTPG